MEELQNSCDTNEYYIWPWAGVVANIPVQRKNGRFVGESGSKLRDELNQKGFNPLRVHPVWNFRGHSGYAIVEFKSELSGLSDAIRFEKAYEANHQGKADYLEVEGRGDNKLYCWMARKEDFNADNAVGDYFRKKNLDLKTISQYQEEEKRKDSQLVSSLTNEIQAKDMCLKEMETKYMETSMSLSNLIGQKDEMIKTFNEEREKMQQNARGQLKHILQEHERVTSELEVQKKELMEREKELEKREAHNEKETWDLHYEKQQNERAILEQQRADEKLLRLAEDHKREKEKLQRKTIDLEKKLDAKQALQLEIRRLQGNLEVIKHMGNVEDEEVTEKLKAIQRELNEKGEELDDIDALNQALIVKERKSNDELQDARKELIEGLKGQSSRAIIGVKRMGELDSETFVKAAKRKYPGQDEQVKGTELCSWWDSHIRDPSWHPFKIVPAENGKHHKTIINEEDEKLKKLKTELGNEVFQAVTTTLMEVNEYNPSGSYIVTELWNHRDERRATLKEGVSHLMKQWALLKRKKR